MPYSPHQTSSPSHLLEIHSIGNISSSAAHISSPLWAEEQQLYSPQISKLPAALSGQGGDYPTWQSASVMRQDKTCLDHYEFETGMKLCILPKLKVQGQRRAGDLVGRGSDFQHFHFFHSVTQRHIFNHPCQLMDVTFNGSVHFSVLISPATFMNHFKFDVIQSILGLWIQLDFLPDSCLKWTYWFLWLLHNVPMSWLVCLSAPSPQFIPFPPALTMSSSHWILLFIHIWWWDCTTYKHGHNKLIFQTRICWGLIYLATKKEKKWMALLD